LPAERTGAPVKSTSLSMASVWSPCRWLISTRAMRPRAGDFCDVLIVVGPGSTTTDLVTACTT